MSRQTRGITRTSTIVNNGPRNMCKSSCSCVAWELQGSVADVDVRLGSALDLFGLEALQVFREPGQDTKVLVGWGADTVVVAFRGTASFANVLNDIQVRIALSAFQ